MNKALMTCEVCGHSTTYLHCKVRCFNCGHFLDCSDLEIPGGAIESTDPTPPATTISVPGSWQDSTATPGGS